MTVPVHMHKSNTGQQTANKRPTNGQQTVNKRPTNGQQTITNDQQTTPTRGTGHWRRARDVCGGCLLVVCWSFVGRLLAICWLSTPRTPTEPPWNTTRTPPEHSQNTPEHHGNTPKTPPEFRGDRMTPSGPLNKRGTALWPFHKIHCTEMGLCHLAFSSTAKRLVLRRPCWDVSGMTLSESYMAQTESYMTRSESYI